LGTYVPGSTGTGKSTLLLNMILQDMEAGLGGAFVDPDHDLVADLLPRIPAHRRSDVVLLDLVDQDYAFGLNPFQCHDRNDDASVAYVLDGVMQAFSRLWGSSMWETPLLADYLRNTATVMILTGRTMVDLARMIRPKEWKFRYQLLSSLPTRYGYLREFWEDHEAMTKPEKEKRLQSLAIRVRAFTDNPITRSIFSQPRSTVDWREVMDQRGIVLLALDPRTEWLSTFIGSLMLGQLYDAATSRVDTDRPDRTPFALYVDEYQKVATAATAKLLKGGRKFGMMPTISHQVRADLDDTTKAATLQAGNLIVFRVIGEDATVLSKQFKVDPKPREKILKMITESVYDEWTEEVWDPPSAKAEWESWQARGSDAHNTIHMLGRSLESEVQRKYVTQNKEHSVAFDPWTLALAVTEGKVSDEELTTAFRVNGYPRRDGGWYKHEESTALVREDREWRVFRARMRWISAVESSLSCPTFFGGEPMPVEDHRRLLAELAPILDPVRFTVEFHEKRSWPGAKTSSPMPRKTMFPEAVAWYRRTMTEYVRRVRETTEELNRIRTHHFRKVPRKRYLYERPVKDTVRSKVTYSGVAEVNQYEEVDGPPRAIVDVQNEVANLMATLDVATARVRLTVGDTSSEHTMRTLPPPPPVAPWKPAPNRQPAPPPVTDVQEDADVYADEPPISLRR
jgi:hypothetical protein